MNTQRPALVLVMLLCSALNIAISQTWDPFRDWSLARNPNGVWEFGGMQGNPGVTPYNPVAFPSNMPALIACSPGLEAWTEDRAVVFRNPLSSTLSCPPHYPALSIGMDDPRNGNYPYIRFRAPAAGLYTLDTSWQQVPGNSAHTNRSQMWFVRGNSALNIGPVRPGGAFMTQVSLQAGEDFIVMHEGVGSETTMAFSRFVVTAPSTGTSYGNPANASLTVNGIGATGLGPFPVTLGRGSPVTLAWSGPAYSPFLLVSGQQAFPGFSFPGMGTFALGIAPTFSDLEILVSGLQGPASFLYRLDASGNATQTFTLPPSTPAGPFLNLQGIVCQPGATAPNCNVVLTAAFFLAVQ